MAGGSIAIVASSIKRLWLCGSRRARTPATTKTTNKRMEKSGTIMKRRGSIPKGATPRTTPWSAVNVPTTTINPAIAAPATPSWRWRAIRFAATSLT